VQAVRQRLLDVTCTCARPTSEQHRGVWYSCLLTLIVREISNLQARFLLAKLNPSATYNTSSAVSSEIIMTDDVSLQVGGAQAGLVALLSWAWAVLRGWGSLSVRSVQP